MGRCRFRPIAYRMGLGFLALGFVLVALGYGFPTWVRRSSRKTQGLWHVCGRQWTSCRFITNHDDVLLLAVRSVLAGCLLMYLVTFAMALRENCCSPNFYTCCLAGRKTEVFAFFAELLGIAGMVLFSIDEYETAGDFNRLSWGHALCDFGLAVSLIGSIMMACAQQSLPAAKAAAGRIVAKPPGYESLAANHRSASLQSRSTHCTQASPFEGRPSTPHISGPYPSPAAIAAVNAAVSPKQQRPASSAAGGSSSASSPQQRKLSSPTPYPALGDSQASPSRRRKSSGQGKQFAGVHNHGKHPPLFASEHVQEEWRVQQSATWSEDMRVVEEEMGSDGVRKQRALKSQIEQHHELQQQHANTWSASANSGDRERSWAHSAYAEHHYDRDWHATSRSEQYGHPKMPPPPAPPSAVAPANYGHYGGPARESCYPGNPHQPADGGQALAGGYQYPGPVGYPSQPQWGPQHHHYQQQQQHQHHQQQQQQQRPDSGNFPDPPPPEQLLCYEEERPTDTPSYHGYPNPIPGDDVCVPLPQQAPVQPVVLYRAPSQPGQSPVTETVTIRPQDPYHAPQPRPTTPHGSPLVLTHIQQAQSPQHHNSPLHSQQQQHQTFPRQQPAHAPASPHSYSTFGR